MPQSTRLYTAGQAGATQAGFIAQNTQGASIAKASLPALQVFTGTSETQFTDPGLNNAYPLALAIPPGGPCEQEPFSVVLSGYVKAGQATTIVFKFYQNNSATIGSNHLMVTTASVSLGAAGTFPFSGEFKLIYDSVSGKIDVQSVSFVIDGVITAPTIATMPLSESISNTANPVLTFTLTGTFGTGSSGTPNTINLKDFGVNH
jgi:hypothetical protein